MLFWGEWSFLMPELSVPLPLLIPTIKGVALAGAEGNCWPQNCFASLKIQGEGVDKRHFSHIRRVPGSGECTWQHLGYGGRYWSLVWVKGLQVDHMLPLLLCFLWVHLWAS